MKIIIKNLAIEYTDEGKGETILLLHGWGDNLHTFDKITPDLSKNYRVIRVDLPGFGGSERPKEAWNLADYASFVNDFLTKINVQPTATLGHSFGGRIAIKGLSEGKITSKKLILVASAGVAKRRTVKNILIMIMTKIGNIITFIPPLIFWREKIKSKLYAKLGSDYNNAGKLKETFLNVIKEDLSKDAKSIVTPTLLIWGDADTATPLEEGKRINNLIKHSRLETIENAGHFVHMEKPAKVAKLIEEFLC